MKRKLPTILILLVMVLIGAMHWVDLSYYTDPVTGFVTQGSVWVRYLVLLLPLVMVLLGLRTVGPRALAVLRVRNPVLGALFAVAAIAGGAYGAVAVVSGLAALSAFQIVLGALCVVYAIWMVLCAIQMFTQATPAPTGSALPGVFAALPFCILSVYRVMVNPTSLYRVAPLVSALSAIFAMLWVGMLLRSLYIALPHRRVRWMYFFGAFTFLFSTCLELPSAVFSAMFRSFDLPSLLQGVLMGTLGLVAGAVSVSIAGQAEEPMHMDEDLSPASDGSSKSGVVDSAVP